MEDRQKEQGGDVTSAAFPRFLILTALLCGTFIMVVEVLGSRVIGPFFGVSLFVWSSLIAVAMIALALGYALGGVVSDRRGHPDYLYFIILAAGLLVMLIPVVKGPVLLACMSLGLRAGAFASSLLLFGPPLMLLGCVSPYVVRIAVREMESIGRTVGSFYAISTLGSVAGTMLTGFVLIAYIGVSKIFILVGGLLVLLSAAYFVFIRKKRVAAVLVLVPLLYFAAPEAAKVELRLPSGTVAKVLLNKDTYYGNIKVVDYTYGAVHTRQLLVDGTIQSGIDMSNGMSISPYTYLLGILPRAVNPDGKNCLVVGLGGGVIPRWFEARGVEADVVDVDPAIVEISREYFGYKASGKTAITDARYFLTNGEKRYDYIVMDVFSGESAPAHVLSLEAFQAARQRMTERGVLALNFIGQLGEEDFMTASVVKTLHEVFDNVHVYPNFNPESGGGMGNMAILAYGGDEVEISSELINERNVHPWVLKDVTSYFQWKLQDPPEAGGVVLTDDYNPIDCYDNRVKEFMRKNVLEGTAWEILTSMFRKTSLIEGA